MSLEEIIEFHKCFNHTCQYCGLDASRDFDTWYYANLSIDHIKPKKHGGTDDPDNLTLSCHMCNLVKGSVPCNSLEEARAIVARKRAEYRQWFDRHVRGPIGDKRR